MTKAVVEFRMPSLGADMEAGTLVEWLVKPGDRVKRGDIVAVVETQKGAIEIEIFETGRIEQLLVDLDAKVPVGTPLARILSDLEATAGAASAPILPTVFMTIANAPSLPSFSALVNTGTAALGIFGKASAAASRTSLSLSARAATRASTTASGSASMRPSV